MSVCTHIHFFSHDNKGLWVAAKEKAFKENQESRFESAEWRALLPHQHVCLDRHFVNDRESLVFTCSFLGPMLFGCLMALLVWSVFQIFLPPGPVQNTIFSLLGSILFSAYIVYDTDNLIQSKPPLLLSSLVAVLFEKKRKEKTAPFGVNLMRSPISYRAAQAVLSDSLASVALPACHLYASIMNLLGVAFVCQCCNEVGDLCQSLCCQLTRTCFSMPACERCLVHLHSTV